MGKITNGIIGEVRRRIGSVTTYLLNGENIVYVEHSCNDGKVTPARVAQLEK